MCTISGMTFRAPPCTLNNPAIKNKEQVKRKRKRKELRVQDTNKGESKQETKWTKQKKKE